MTPSDRTVRAAILGDQPARDVVGRWLYREVRAYFAMRYRDADHLDDVLQSAMVVIWANKYGKAPQHAAGLRAWSIGVMVMEVVATRRLGRRDRYRQEAIHADMPKPKRAVSPDSIVDLETIAACVEELTTPHREAVIARVYEHTPRRVAAEQGVKPGTIRKRYSTAVDEIKRMLGLDTLPGQDAPEQRADETPPNL